MNHIYKVIWNQSLGRFVVCSELGKKKKSNTKSIVTAAILAGSLLLSPALANDKELHFTGAEGKEFFNYKNWGLKASDLIVESHGLAGFTWNLNPTEDPNAPKYKFLINRDVEMRLNKEHTLSRTSVHISDGSSLKVYLPNMLEGVTGNYQLKLISQGDLTFDSASCDTLCGSYILHTAKIGSQDKNRPAKLNIQNGNLSFIEGMHSVDYKGVDIGSLSMGTQGTFGEAEVDGGYLKLGYAGLSSIGLNEGDGQDLVFRLGADNGHGKMSVLNGGKIGINTLIYSNIDVDFTELDEQNNHMNFNTLTEVLSNTNGVAIIGKNGLGELFVSGENKDTKQRSIIASGRQISLGVGKNGHGSVTIKDGGTFQSYVEPNAHYSMSQFLPDYDVDEEEVDRLIGAGATRLGIDGGYGHITVSGKASSVEIGGINNGFINDNGSVGELAIGHSGIGEVTIDNLGQVRIGSIVEARNEDGIGQGHIFMPGTYIDSETGEELIAYGKTILATGKTATGIINFTGDGYNEQSVKASDQLLTSDISVGRGQGMVNLDHNATADNPFVFDIQIKEDFNKIYHSDFNFNAEPTKVDIGQISFNHKNGVTLLKAHDFRGFEVDREKDQTTFSYSGDTNIIGGELQVEDKNLLSQQSHFNIEKAGHLNIKNADQSIKSLHNDGLLSLGERSANKNMPSENVLIVENDYSGGGAIMMNSSWNTPRDSTSITADDSSTTDQLRIKGNVKTGTKTIIDIHGGTITGNVKLTNDQIENEVSIYSLPVVIVEGDASMTSFIGEVKTSQDGQLAKIAHRKSEEGNTFLWSLGVVNSVEENDPPAHIPILEGKIAAITQMGSANNEQLTLGVGKYIERRAVAIDDPLWVRQYGQHLSLTGKNRFSYDSNIWGMQMGYDLYQGETANGTQKVGIFTGYSHNSLKFKDQYRTEIGSAMISANKRSGSGKTSMFSVGGYYTWLTDNNAYVDIVAMFSHIENKYQPNDYTEFKQHGYGLSLSLEGGYPIAIADTPWQIIPQGQLVYQYLHLKDKKVSGVSFQGVKDAAVLGRVGAQAMYTLDTNSYIYAGIDVWHQFDKNKAINYGNSHFQEKYNQSWVELSAGVDYRINSDVSFFGNMSVQQNLGGKKRESYKGNIGLKISL